MTRLHEKVDDRFYQLLHLLIGLHVRKTLCSRSCNSPLDLECTCL